MKKFLLICCMLLFLCSCTQGPVTEDNTPPNNSYEKDSASADAEEINITSMLSLQQDQSYVVCDYFEGNVLILISDSSKQNSNDITDQATTVFFEEFVVLNIQTQSIINRYPIQEFGICPSAIQAFGGVVYPFFSVGTNQMDSSIIFIDSSGKTVIYHGEFTPFSTGPVLHRYQDCLLFSFFNYKNNTFGISRIDSKFDVAPVLTFEASDAVIKGIRVGALKSVLYDGVYSIFSTMKLFWERIAFSYSRHRAGRCANQCLEQPVCICC